MPEEEEEVEDPQEELEDLDGHLPPIRDIRPGSKQKARKKLITENL
jgi:hypothetical protein